jgi:TRAP-type C4-dicarboxylate transport system substrate-binding protein
MTKKLGITLLTAAFALVGGERIAQAKVELKMATLAPPQSPWGKVFKKWSKRVKNKTDGEVELTWLWNGTAGPEGGAVGKIKSGQLQGAAITAVGLSAIHKPIVALQMPGAFDSWSDIDKARETLAKEFQSAAESKGFYISGWGDVGIGRVFSKGFAVKVPDDLKGKKPAVIREDVIGPKIYEAIGGVTPVPGSVTEFLPMLNSGAINVMNTPPLACEQLQWASKLDHINTARTYFGIGALVLSQKALEKLSAEQRAIVEEQGKKAARRLTKQIRKKDDEALDRLKKKMTVHEPTDAEKAEWKKVFKAGCLKAKSALPGDVLQKIGAC